MINASPEGVPKSPVAGMNTKITGRVAPVEAVKSPVIKQAAEHKPIEKMAACEKQACEKAAGLFRPEETLSGAKAIGQHALMAMGTVAGTALASAGLSKLHSMIARPGYDKSLERAIELNPRLSKLPRKELESYFGLIVEASPSVAKNPLLVANYLEYLVDHQGQLNFQAYSNLVNLEGQVLSNRTNANPLTSAGQKSIVDGTIKGMFHGMSAESEASIHAKGREQGLRDGREQGYHAAMNNMGGQP